MKKATKIQLLKKLNQVEKEMEDWKKKRRRKLTTARAYSSAYRRSLKTGNS